MVPMVHSVDVSHSSVANDNNGAFVPSQVNQLHICLLIAYKRDNPLLADVYLCIHIQEDELKSTLNYLRILIALKTIARVHKSTSNSKIRFHLFFLLYVIFVFFFRSTPLCLLLWHPNSNVQAKSVWMTTTTMGFSSLEYSLISSGGVVGTCLPSYY